MDDVFLSEVDLNSHDDWETITAAEVSFLPGSTESESDILAVQIDIAAPLSTLKRILQQKFGADLSHCELWLQDVLQLDEETTLSEQCIQGEGVVQVNLELKTVLNCDRINILDVLKPPDDEPTEECVPAPDNTNLSEVSLQSYVVAEPTKSAQREIAVVEKVEEASTSISNRDCLQVNNPSTSVGFISPAVPTRGPIVNRNAKQSIKKPNENITRWVMDSGFRKDQERLKIPLDPALWTQIHVQHWIVWAINQFNLKDVNPSKWSWIDGPSLCSMSHSDFMEKVPNDPNDLFWTHLELLRKCKFVGVIQKPVPYLQYVTTPLTVKGDSTKTLRPVTKTPPTRTMNLAPQDPLAAATTGSGIRPVGSNGQVQLWQFLLELLTDKNFRDAISWLGTGGEFKLNNPEMVAHLWGERKNKPNMNYEKLSRALRYYYDGDMICKVSGQRFVYKFVCDLKQLLGYSAAELNKLVTECEQKSKMKRASLYM